MRLAEAALAAAESLHGRQAKRDSSVVPTPRRFLLEALGCDFRAEPVAYFEYEHLYELLKGARTAIEESSGLGLEQITLQPDTWLEELRDLLKPLPDLPAPEPPTLRPGCEPKLRAGTCRLPTIGVVAVAHFALDQSPEATLASALEALEITPSTLSFDILKATDPTLRDAAVPEGLAELREKLVPPVRTDDDDSRAITAGLLHRLAERYDNVAVRDLTST